MDKKQLYIIIAMAAIVGAGIVFALLGWNKPGVENTAPVGSVTSTSSEQIKISKIYNPQIPAGATLSVVKSEAPANSNPNSDAKIKFFDLQATKSGFSIPQIVVTQGDSLSVNFTAMDGDYDVDIPYLGAYFSVIKKGETKKLPFDTSTTGTFVMECRDYCPSSGQIKGSLVVLPRK